MWWLQSGLGRIKANLASRVKKGKMSQAAAEAAMGLVTGTLEYNTFGEL
jgi:enoyl-CoA hydratase/3-hydroxyacyl-CoA dehydrogenase